MYPYGCCYIPACSVEYEVCNVLDSSPHLIDKSSHAESLRLESQRPGASLLSENIYSQSNYLSLKLHTHPAELQHEAEDEDMKNSLLTLSIPHVLSPKHTNPCMQSPSPNHSLKKASTWECSIYSNEPIHIAAGLPHQPPKGAIAEPAYLSSSSHTSYLPERTPVSRSFIVSHPSPLSQEKRQHKSVARPQKHNTHILNPASSPHYIYRTMNPRELIPPCPTHFSSLLPNTYNSPLPTTSPSYRSTQSSISPSFPFIKQNPNLTYPTPSHLIQQHSRARNHSS